MTNPLFDALFAPHTGREEAFLHLADGSTAGYGEFLRTAARLAHALVAAGLGPGDRVAAQVPKSPEALALYAAAVQAGAVFLPLNTAYTVEELRYFIADSGAGLIVCDPADETALAPVARENSAGLTTLDAGGGGRLMEAAAGLPGTFTTVDRREDDLAALLYTSGTTGRSKGAMLSHRNLLSNTETLVDCWRFTSDDVLLHALPVHHTHGLFVAVNVTLLAGGSMIYLPRFDPDAVLEGMPRATTMMGVPTFYTRLLDDPRLDRGTTAHMRLFVSGSAPLLAETHEAFGERTGHRILERYGMTETGMNTSNPYDGERRPGTVGHPLPGIEIRIADPESGTLLDQGEVGVVEIKGDNVFCGYWNRPEETAREFRPDGFFVSGDLGRMDGDGYLHIVGREKDLIISGGLNIYPVEIEEALNRQPGVGESAVIGVPHADFGEAVVAVVTPDKDTALDVEAILAGAAGGLARFKHPKEVIVVEELPRNNMGKVQKNVLREAHKDTFAS